MALPLFQYKVIDFNLGVNVDLTAYSAWLIAHPLAEIVSTSMMDGASNGPTIVVTYRQPASLI